MGTQRTEEIIAFARDVRNKWGRNPLDIAKRMGIKVIYVDGDTPGAQIIKAEKYPTIISIVGCKNPKGRQVLCAHELGHAFLHDEGVNRFDGTYETIVNDIEYEANLFAVAFFFDDWQFNMPIANMSNYVLKRVLDYNVQ